jgi:cyanophycinase-like exopeptidase
LEAGGAAAAAATGGAAAAVGCRDARKVDNRRHYYAGAVFGQQLHPVPRAKAIEPRADPTCGARRLKISPHGTVFSHVRRSRPESEPVGTAREARGLNKFSEDGGLNEDGGSKKPGL